MVSAILFTRSGFFPVTLLPILSFIGYTYLQYREVIEDGDEDNYRILIILLLASCIHMVIWIYLYWYDSKFQDIRMNLN